MDDPEIIDLYWERSESAISETDAKYKGLCLHVAGNILRDNSDAEECLNDTWLAAWNAMPSKRPKYLPAFLCRIIKNLALKRCEYNSARKRNPEVLVSLDELDDCVPSGEDVEAACDAAELGRIISDFLRSQPASNGRTGVIGMCSGGRHAYLAACTVKGFDAAVDCWGGGVVMKETDLSPARPVAPIDYTDELEIPLMGIFGNDDHSPTPEDVDRTEEALKAAGFNAEGYVSDGTAHEFLTWRRSLRQMAPKLFK